MLLHELATASRDVGALSGRLDKVRRLADVLARLPPESARAGVSWLSGQLPQGRIGIGPALLFGALEAVPAADEPTLTLAETDAAFDRVAAATGPGSTAERGRVLRALFARATGLEREFLARVVMGELRQGAAEGVLLEAVALAGGRAPADVRRAVMMRGSASAVGGSLLGGAEGALDQGLE